MKDKTPLQRVLAVFVSGAEISRILGVDRSNVTHWENNGGQIPLKHHKRLIDKSVEAADKRNEGLPDNSKDRIKPLTRECLES
jgi:hypothetical protein